MVKGKMKKIGENNQKMGGRTQRRGGKDASLALNSKMVRTNASIRGQGTEVTIRHREYIRNLDMYNDDFRVDYLEVNPGLPTNFPWLSQIAACYDFYRFTKLKLVYVPRCPTTTAGSVMIAADYDVADYEPTSKMMMMSFTDAMSSNVWGPLEYSLRPELMSRFTKDHYIRSTAVDNTDARNYDVACIYFATSGSALAYNVGELYLEYEVVLSSPHLDPTDRAFYTSADIVAVGPTKAEPLGTGEFSNAEPLDPVAERFNSTQFYLRKAGEYVLDFIVNGTDLTVAPITAIGTHVVSAVGNAVVNAALTSSIQRVGIKVSRPDVVQIGIPAAWTTLSYLKMAISPYKASLVV